MLDFPRWKIICVWLICLGGLYVALPNMFSEQTRSQYASVFRGPTMNLGLDLRGGSHLLLKVDFDVYKKEQLETLVDDVRKHLQEAKIGYRDLSLIGDEIKFSLTAKEDADKARDSLKDLYREVQMESAGDTGFSIRYRDDAIKNMQQKLLGQSIEIVRRRVDETGTREPIIQRQGDDRILLQVPGLDNPEHLKGLLGKTAKMAFHLMDETSPMPPESVKHAPPGEMLLKDKEGRHYLVKKKVELSGDMLVDSQPNFQNGQPVVGFRFNNQGGRRFAAITSENAGKPFAVVLDGEVITAPRINEPILGGSGIISGNFTVQSANDLSLLLRAGALPAPLVVVEERTVGPSLGQDSIDAGKASVVAAIAVVACVMLALYGLFGVFALAGLFINMILVVAVLSLFHATLTMPGIAGMVLTIGMAVDANVLIFERIREEARLGKTPFAAIDHGFSRAFNTIVDANVTMLFATLLMYMYGSGPVKGFAVTLSAGIVCSMFTAISLTRMMILIWLKRTRPKKLEL